MVNKNPRICGCDCPARRDVKLIGGRLCQTTCNLPLLCTRCSENRFAVSMVRDRIECRSCSPLFTDRFFSKDLDLEAELFDGFIYTAGGVRVTDLLSRPPKGENADYYFEEPDVILELKILATEFTDSEGHLKRFAELVARWASEGRLSVDVLAGKASPPNEFVLAHHRLLVSPLQRISNKANRQIRNTKVLLNRPDARGVVLYLNDGFLNVPPAMTMGIIGDPMTRNMMRQIEAYVVFSLRERIVIPGIPGKQLFWEPTYREPEKSVALSEFINDLGRRSNAYLQELAGTTFQRVMEVENDHGLSFRSAVFARDRSK